MQDLLGRCVKQSTTFSEVLSVNLGRLNSKTEINQFSFRQIVEVSEDYVIKLDVSMDDVLLIVEVL